MTVYVDDAFIPYRRMKMAERIGVDERWLQHGGTYKEHFDICSSKRLLSIGRGAVPISRRELARRVAARRT